MSDRELDTLKQVATLIEALESDAQRRVLDYLEQRFGRGRCDGRWESRGPMWHHTFHCSLLKGHGNSCTDANGASKPDPPDDL